MNSPIRGRAFFQNVGTTLRQGVDLNLQLKTDRLLAWFAYSYIDATFQSGFIASSTNNPGTDANGNIQVQPGNHLPGIPSNLWKMGVGYNVTDAWTVGGTGTAVSGQFLFGDEANLTAKTPAYFVLILHTSYQLTTHCGPSTVPGAPRGGDVSAESGTASLPAHQKSRSPLRDDDRK